MGAIERSNIENKGIWKRFLHTVRNAGLPYGMLGIYIALTVIEGQILIRIPEVSGNFFAGDVRPASVGKFIGLDLLNMAVVQSVLYVNHILRYRMNRNLRNSLWGKLLRLKPSYYDRVSASSLISRVTVDSDAINTFVLDVVLEFFVQAYYLTITVREMNKISLNVGFMLLGFLPLTFLIAFVVGRISMKLESNMKFMLSDLTEYLSELISVLPLLKAMNRQAYEKKRGNAAIDNYYKANRNVIGLDVARELVGSAAGIGPELVILLLGIKYLSNGSFDGAAWYTFYIYAGTFIGFCGTLSSMWEQSKAVQGQLKRVSDVLYEDEETVGAYTEEIVDSDDIIFDHVDFSYEEKPILEDANFVIPHNKYTVLIGRSGMGKSTSLKLIERMYQPSGGRILMGGHDINETGVRDWRKRLAYVSQNTPLLSGSIRDSILYGNDSSISDEEIMEAARLVRLDSFIEQSPDGLNRQTGAFGEELSGGQRQKISVARAILSGADILILDEPTASLDILSTREIMNAVSKLRGSRTVIMVTHDGSMISGADHIVVFDDDHRIYEGTPEEMNRISGFCRQLLTGGGELDA